MRSKMGVKSKDRWVVAQASADFIYCTLGRFFSPRCSPLIGSFSGADLRPVRTHSHPILCGHRFFIGAQVAVLLQCICCFLPLHLLYHCGPRTLYSSGCNNLLFCKMHSLRRSYRHFTNLRLSHWDFFLIKPFSTQIFMSLNILVHLNA